MNKKVKKVISRAHGTLFIYEDDSKLLFASDGMQMEYPATFSIKELGFGKTFKQKCLSFAWKSAKFLGDWCVKKPAMTWVIGPAWNYTKRVPYFTFPLVVGSSIYAYFNPEHSMEMLTQMGQYLKAMVS